MNDKERIDLLLTDQAKIEEQIGELTNVLNLSAKAEYERAIAYSKLNERLKLIENKIIEEYEPKFMVANHSEQSLDMVQKQIDDLTKNHIPDAQKIVDEIQEINIILKQYAKHIDRLDDSIDDLYNTKNSSNSTDINRIDERIIKKPANICDICLDSLNLPRPEINGKINPAWLVKFLIDPYKYIEIEENKICGIPNLGIYIYEKKPQKDFEQKIYKGETALRLFIYDEDNDKGIELNNIFNIETSFPWEQSLFCKEDK